MWKMPEDLEKNIASAEAPAIEREAVPEKEPAHVEAAAPSREAAPVAAPVTPIAASEPAPAAAASDPLTESLEMILSEDLGDFYRAMPPATRENFKKKGEETVSRIRSIWGNATLKAKEVLKLIVSWLKIIPGINRFFLEQESKIKTDKIIELHRRSRGE